MSSLAKQFPILNSGRAPRRNLPICISRKRGESDFVLKFASAYTAQLRGLSTDVLRVGRELAVDQYGIADLVLVRQVDRKVTKSDVLIEAFEMKLSDWKRGLMQAIRYVNFANKTSLVLPPLAATKAWENAEIFERLGVGLIQFDAKTGDLDVLVESQLMIPRCQKTRGRTIEFLLPKSV